MNVIIELHVEQVEESRLYKGYVKINRTKLDYELRFDVPIPLLLDLVLTKPVNKPDEIRNRFQLKLKFEEVEINLKYSEFEFFLSILLNFVVDFYTSSQTRGNKKGLTAICSHYIPPKLWKALNIRKFGYPLAE